MLYPAELRGHLWVNQVVMRHGRPRQTADAIRTLPTGPNYTIFGPELVEPLCRFGLHRLARVAKEIDGDT